MTFQKLQEAGRKMSEVEIAASLRSLANDARFPAVAELIRRQKELASDGSAQLKFANNAGCLAHAAGVRYGMIELEGSLKQACEAPRKRGEKAPPSEMTSEE